MKIDENIKKNSIAILGLGLTGLSVIEYLKYHGYNLICWDDDRSKREKFINTNIKLHDLSDPKIWSKIDLLLISPGIPFLYPKAHPAVMNAIDNSVRIENDIGLFFQEVKNRKKNTKSICITGSNGKSTTASLIHHVLLGLSKNSEIGGNIGKPVLKFSMSNDEALRVIELSSYQIEIANFLMPYIAIFLNFSTDHLDRHGGIGGYFNSKASLFYKGMPKYSIIGVDQPEGKFLANSLENNSYFDTNVIQISSNKVLSKSKWSVSLIDNFIIEMRNGLEVFRSDIKKVINLPGDHNLINACVAFITCKLLKNNPPEILEKMKSFKGLPHRSSFVKKVKEVTFINDSKATNMFSALKSIDTYDDIRWIAGGQKKEGDKFDLSPYLKKIKKIYLIGSSAIELSKFLHDIEFSICSNLNSAVQKAYKDSEPGDTVLFAPGCASFDQFKNFEKRGEKFCDFVNQL